jgi:hypothetical protein
MDDRPPLLPGARRAPRALRCLPGSHFDAYLDQFPLAAAVGTEWFREHLLSPGVNRSWPMLRSTAASPWPIPTLRIPHKPGRDLRGRSTSRPLVSSQPNHLPDSSRLQTSADASQIHDTHHVICACMQHACVRQRRTLCGVVCVVGETILEAASS